MRNVLDAVEAERSRSGHRIVPRIYGVQAHGEPSISAKSSTGWADAESALRERFPTRAISGYFVVLGYDRSA